MAKKDKSKETDIVKKETKRNVARKEKESSIALNLFQVASTISALLFIGLAILAYIVYKDVTNVPNMPELDLNKWWGANSTEHQDTSIRPYRIVFSDSMDSEIRRRFEVYRRSNKNKSFENTAWTYGIHSEAFEKIFSYWIFKYNFRERERFFNQFEQYKTNIQGLDIHYVHVKSKVDENVTVLPMLLLHGWPGSVREFYEAIPLLTTVRPGYNFVFEIIAPSLPGFGFSQAAVRPGLSPHQVAIVMRNLMQRLGHQYYYVQGGDFGHAIGSHMATIFPQEVLGFHTNLPVSFSKYAYLTWMFGAIWPTFVANGYADRMYPLMEKLKFYLEEFGYLHLQVTKPDTIGIALQDSPVGLASYILDRLMVFTDPANKFDPEGGLDKYYTYDKLLDNIMLYWISGSITTSIRLYKEAFADSYVEQVFARIPTSVPTWGLRFKYELSYNPDFILRWKFPNLLGTTNYDFGGHFAAMERPEEFSKSIFEAVNAFLEFQK